ncbi:unnamed protein product [Rotaria socialis]|uniref:Uncharacterized protein n=1 Tax=Rotaria socialis TaxID=392032 RepID=A0A820R2F7_9BILA|nr:unnamed protein product [Rotaria socialis]CAF4429981.1 unnamed protein product [Rotaria socialis]
MSHPCAVANCQRSSRALCHCCQQNICRDHLIEHDDLLNSRLNPIVDEINQLNDRLNHINLKDALVDTHEQLENWRRKSYRAIDEFINEQSCIIYESMQSKLENISDGIIHLKTLVGQLIRKQDTTIDNLNTLGLNIQSIQREIIEIENKSIGLSLTPLTIDRNIIQMQETGVKYDINLENLMPAIHVINRSAESHKPLASNNKVLLMHHDHRLSILNHELTLVKSIPWPHNWIWDMCWSSTLSQFLIITLGEIFSLDENTMSLECIQTKDQYSLSACTCSDKSLYLASNVLGSSVYELSLLPDIKLVNQYQSKDLCDTDETIHDMIFHKGTLAFIIGNFTSHRKHMALRSSQTFELIWSIQFDTVDPMHNIYRVGLFNYNEWLVIDWKTSEIFHISKDGQLKSKLTYDQVPYRSCQFGPNTLVISAKNSVNFHKM